MVFVKVTLNIILFFFQKYEVTMTKYCYLFIVDSEQLDIF